MLLGELLQAVLLVARMLQELVREPEQRQQELRQVRALVRHQEGVLVPQRLLHEAEA
jgi:hypothetical protein